MRRSFAAVAVFMAACSGDDGMLPVGGGGGFDGGVLVDSRLVDGRIVDSATPPSPIDAALIMGRVCLANDPRRLNECANTGAGGLTVRLGDGPTTTTAADGRFTITASAGTWRVTGSNIVTSIMTLADYEIPAITRTSYDAMLAASLVPPMLNPGEGSVMIQVIRNGVGSGLAATATSTPTSTFFPRYDSDASAATWAIDNTHAAGTVWIPGIDVGTASIAVTAGGTTITDPGQPIVDGAITFTTVIFGP